MGSGKDTPIAGPLVSIVMPAFRMGAFIANALTSVEAQGYRNWELIVVDDHGPEDGTADLVARCAERMPEHRVEWIRHPENKGVSAARNTGIAAARGELVAFIDPDDQWFSDHLERIMGRFGEMTQLDVVTGPVEIVEDGPNGRPPRVSARGDWHRTYFPHTLAIYNYIQPSATMVRRAALETVGGFDTDPLIQHIEDYDLWIRLVNAGCKFAFLDTPTSRYRLHQGGATADVQRMRELDEYLVRKHTGFFRRANAILHQQMLADLGRLDRERLRLDRELVNMRIAFNGPVLRSLAAIDRVLRRAYRALRPSKG